NRSAPTCVSLKQDATFAGDHTDPLTFYCTIDLVWKLHFGRRWFKARFSNKPINLLSIESFSHPGYLLPEARIGSYGLDNDMV
ncbi:MAG: hypothetical protein AAFY91_07690, partial [Bacteroidota bacterium]